jgi:hypothetical protein
MDHRFTKLRPFIWFGIALCLGAAARAQTVGPITYPSSPQQVQVTGSAITTSGNVIVSNGANVAFIATQSLLLGPGFQVQAGGVFSGVPSPQGFSTTLIPAISSLAFGQTTTLTATTTMAGVSSQAIDYSTNGTTWVNGASWSGVPPSNGINTLTWTVPTSILNSSGTWQIRASGGDGPVATPYATGSITVAKASPIVITRTFSAGYTVTQADLNNLLVNPYSSSVAAPTGSVSYSIVVPSGTLPPTITKPLTVGTIIPPGTYTIQVTYGGDANYNSSGSGTDNGTWMDSSADSFIYDAAGRLTSATQCNGMIHSYSPDEEANLDSISHSSTNVSGNGIPDWWQYYYFQENNGIDPQGDPTGDGISNLMKSMLGDNPLVASSGPPVAVSTLVYSDGKSYLYFTYTVASDAAASVYMEQSGDHGNIWQFGSTYFAPVSTTDLGTGLETITVRCTTPLPAAYSLLFRLEANGGLNTSAYNLSIPTPIPAASIGALVCLAALLLVVMVRLIRAKIIFSK